MKLTNKDTKILNDTESIVNLLLENRGIKTITEKDTFFNPLHPNELRGRDLLIDSKEVKKAIKIIEDAISKKKKIIVYGDYDVDGICATTILWETLAKMKADALPYIPSRFTEGYGLNQESIKDLKVKYPNLGLIITVDQGIVAHEQVEYAKKLGVKIIVTDHHEPGDTKPKANALIHTTLISGSGVAWFLARELTQETNDDHLGLAALGTISDILPLIRYNRSITVFGLKYLRVSGRVGLQELCFEAGIKQEDIDTYHVGFIIAPRLNAMGRLEHAIDSLRLLCTRRRERAQELAFKMGRINRLRQEKTQDMVEHVNEVFAPGWVEGNIPKLLFVHHESYEEGVIGVVAGRLVDKYHRPVIVVARGEEFSKASARSIQGVNIIDLIRKAGEGLLERAGGHTMAAGFTIKTELLELFGQKLTQVASEIRDEMLVRELRVDCGIEFSLITPQFYQRILKFAPFGYGNPEPTFRTKGVFVESARLMGKENNHIKLLLGDKSGLFEGVGFRMGELYPKLEAGRPIDIIYSIEENFWNGSKKLQLKLRSIQFS